MICFIPVVLVLVWYALRVCTRYPERTVRDVYPFFRYIEGEVLNGSFHPQSEEDFRATHSPKEFKKWQLRRIHLAIHHCRDISTNCRLLVAWAVFERNANWHLHPEAIRNGLRELQIASMQARTAAFAIRLRLRLWLVRIALLPMLPVPNFHALVNHSSTLIKFYNTAEVLAEAMSRIYGEEIHENMLAVLGTVDLELDGLET